MKSFKSILRKGKLFGLSLLALSLAACSSGGGGGENSSAEDGTIEVRIGVTAPLTGPSANSGIGNRQGMELAAEEINAKGFKLGDKPAKLSLFFEDTQAKPEQGVSAAEKLINEKKVDFLIGDSFSSSVTLAIMELAPQYEIPILSAASVSEAIADKVKADPEKYEYFWKNYFGSSAYGVALFDTYSYLEANQHLKAENKVIAFVAEDTDFGRSNTQYVVEAFKNAGWTVAAEEYVPLGHTDFYPQLGKIKAANPDLIVSCFTSLSSGVNFVKQFSEQKVTANSMAIYYPNIPEFKEQAGDAANGLIWSALTFAPDLYPDQQPFAESIRKKYNVEPSSDQANGYDAIYNIVSAFERAQSTDPAKVNEAMAQMNNKGLNGTYKFDLTNHQSMAGPEYIRVPSVQIQNGKDVVIWPENVKTGEYETPSWIQ